MSRRWRRCARSTVSAPSDRRPRPQSRCRPIIATGATPEHPPGLYGPTEGPIAVNTLAAADRIAPLDTASVQRAPRQLHHTEPRDLRGILLSSSLLLFLIDAIIVALLGAGLARAVAAMRTVPAALADRLMLSLMSSATSAGPRRRQQ